MTITGVWKLVSFLSRRDNGAETHPFGEQPQGTLLYTESGHFAVQLMRTDRPRFADADQLKGTGAEIEASFKGCIAYYGSYELDAAGQYVVHYVEGSLFPNWEGQRLKRYVELTDNCLKLSTPPTLWGGGGEIVGVLEWERIG